MTKVAFRRKSLFGTVVLEGESLTDREECQSETRKESWEITVFNHNKLREDWKWYQLNSISSDSFPLQTAPSIADWVYKYKYWHHCYLFLIEPQHAYSRSLCVYFKEISFPICSPVCRFILLPLFLSTAIFCLCVFFSYDLSLFLYCQIPRDHNCWMMRNVSIIVDFSEKSVSALLFLTFGRFHLFGLYWNGQLSY